MRPQYSVPTNSMHCIQKTLSFTNHHMTVSFKIPSQPNLQTNRMVGADKSRFCHQTSCMTANKAQGLLFNSSYYINSLLTHASIFRLVWLPQQCFIAQCELVSLFEWMKKCSKVFLWTGDNEKHCLVFYYLSQSYKATVCQVPEVTIIKKLLYNFLLYKLFYYTNTILCIVDTQ